MRVVAGTARGRRLVAPVGESTRPTPDRVREAVFNALGSLGALAGARVVDLFAGSGAMGIEALSRGAAHATFVERAPGPIRAIEANLAACGFGDVATVVRQDVEAFVTAARATGDRWDLGFLDPPYAFDGWPVLLAALPCDLAVVESDRAVETPAGWEVLRQRRYGRVTVTFIARVDDEDQWPRSTVAP